jgi:hypothetical protein
MSKEYKRFILRKYVDSINGPRQGSDSWLNKKKKTIGGSEMSTIQGINRFSSVPELIKNKIGLGQPFKGNIKTRWGNILEEVICEYVSKDMDTEILGTELYIPGIIEEQSYSPDGLGVIAFDIEYWDNETGKLIAKDTTYKIALFEFKCPFNRIPTGMVPIYYIPQVKAGLDTIELAEVGIFIETVIRVCRWSELGYNHNYNTTLNGNSKSVRDTLPLAYGFVCFIVKKGYEPATRLYEMGKLDRYTSNDQFNDFGEYDEDTLDEIFSLFVNNASTKLIYSKIVMKNKKDTTYNDMRGIVNCISEGDELLGILPWKIFRVDYHIIEKETGYVMKYAEKIKEIIGVVDKCLQNPDKKIDIYNEYVYGRVNENKNYDDEFIWV